MHSLHRAAMPVAMLALVAVLMLIAGVPAFADQPVPWQMGMQAPATPVAERVQDFHTLLMVLMTAVVIVVMALLAYVMVRFRKSANPKPQSWTHNTTIEIVWTAIPVLILVVIAFNSFPLIYYNDRTAEPDVTVKAIAYQWYWGYEYPELEVAEYAAYMIPDEEIDQSAGQVRNLSTDMKVVVPAGKNVQVLVTAGDVLHSWAMPSFAVKKDAVPGRINETWFRVEQPGVYYGQCSELCGTGHGFMPIEVHVVTAEEFDRWVELAREDIDAANTYAIELQRERRQLAMSGTPDAAATN